jgi:hypothetical protein
MKEMNACKVSVNELSDVILALEDEIADLEEGVTDDLEEETRHEGEVIASEDGGGGLKRDRVGSGTLLGVFSAHVGSLTAKTPCQQHASTRAKGLEEEVADDLEEGVTADLEEGVIVAPEGEQRHEDEQQQRPAGNHHHQTRNKPVLPPAGRPLLVAPSQRDNSQREGGIASMAGGFKGASNGGSPPGSSPATPPPLALDTEPSVSATRKETKKRKKASGFSVFSTSQRNASNREHFTGILPTIEITNAQSIEGYLQFQTNTLHVKTTKGDDTCLLNAIGTGTGGSMTPSKKTITGGRDGHVSIADVEKHAGSHGGVFRFEKVKGRLNATVMRVLLLMPGMTLIIIGKVGGVIDGKRWTNQHAICICTTRRVIIDSAAPGKQGYHYQHDDDELRTDGDVEELFKGTFKMTKFLDVRVVMVNANRLDETTHVHWTHLRDRLLSATFSRLLSTTFSRLLSTTFSRLQASGTTITTDIPLITNNIKDTTTASPPTTAAAAAVSKDILQISSLFRR